MSQNPYSPPAAAIADPVETPVKRPALVTVAIVLLWVMVLLKIAGVLYASSKLTVGRHDDMYRTVQIVMQVVTLGYGATYVAFLLAAGRGRNWGRIALSVLAALEVLLMFSTQERALLDSAAQRIGYWLPSGVPVMALILLFTPVANRWYASKRT